MARPREFCADEALEEAMRIFWSKGYAATSLNDLTAAMGLSKSSFYEAFGGKRELFLSALARYIEVTAGRAEALLDGYAPARSAIETMFGFIVGSAASEDSKRGCFLCNCAVEVSPHDAEAAALVRGGMARLENAFLSAVVRGQTSGKIAADRDPRALAGYLLTCAQGLHVMAKANSKKAALNKVVRVVLSALD